MQRRIFLKSGALAVVTMGLSPRFLRRAVLNCQLDLNGLVVEMRDDVV